MIEIDQICLWVAGYPVHDDDESLCVPDFSCCLPDLLAPREIREAYLAAYMRQFNENLRRAAIARNKIERMNLRFLYLRVDGIGAWVAKEHGGLQGWIKKHTDK